MEWWLITQSTLSAVFEIGALCIFGVWLARIEILNQQKQSFLSELTVKVLIPAAFFTSVTKTVSLERLVYLWPIPVFCTFITFLAIGLAYCLQKVLKVPTDLERIFYVASAVSNVNSIPFNLVVSLTNPGGVLDYIPNGREEGVTYVALYTASMNIIFWAFCVPFVKQREKKHTEEYQLKTRGKTKEGEHYDLLNEDDDHHEQHEESSELIEKSVEMSENRSQPDTSIIQMDHYKTTTNSESNITIIQSTFRSIISRIPESVKSVFSPVVSITLLSVIIGLIAPLKSLFFDEKTTGSHNTAPLAAIMRICDYIGAGAMSALLFIMGASLYHFASFNFKKHWRTIFGVFTIKLVVMPIIGISTIYLIRSWNWISPSNYILFFVLCVQCASPPNIYIILLSQHPEISTMMLASYLLSAVTMTLSIVVALYLI